MTKDDWLADPQYRDAVVDLLGRAGLRRADRVHPAGGGQPSSRPRQPLKAAVAGLAVAEFRHY